MKKVILLITLLVLVLGNSVLAAGFIDRIYSRPDYVSKPSYIIPSCVKIIHIENFIDKNSILWVHIKFTGFIVLDGWLPVAQMDNRVILGPTQDQGKLPGRK